MSTPEFTIEEVGRRAMAIGTGFTLKTFRLNSNEHPEKFATNVITDAEGRLLELDESVDQKIHWLSVHKHWLAWIDKKDAEIACFDAPPPTQIRSMLIAEWESSQIASGLGDPGTPAASGTSTRI